MKDRLSITISATSVGVSFAEDLKNHTKEKMQHQCLAYRLTKAEILVASNRSVT